MGTDRTVDVLVIGSGAGGLAAALTAAHHGASVEVIEKADLIGGTSAWSGGEAWVPGNDHIVAEGYEPDSREAAIEYIAALANDRQYDPELVVQYVDEGPRAIRFLEEHSAYSPKVAPANSDYYDDRPGFKLRGRSLAPQVLDAKKVLGDSWRLVRDSPHLPPLADEEFAAEWTKSNLPFHARSKDDTAAPEPDLDDVIAERRETGIRFMGPALVTGLLRGALDAGVVVTTSTAAKRLILEGGRIAGAVVEHEGVESVITARKGVILASGGFEWNTDLVLSYLGLPEIFPMSPNTNVGDGLVMGLEVGATVANMTNVAPIPAIWKGELLETGQAFGTPSGTRTDPGVIIVNRQGRRFMNEGICYMDVFKAFKKYDEFSATYPNDGPVWQIFDASSRRGMRDIGSDTETPDWVREAATVEELAGLIDVDPANLVDEVATWNRYVDDRKDPDFRRGEIWWEGFMMGGPSPEKNMAKIEQGPFFAIALYNGVFATLGGLRIDVNSRVKAARGGLVEGLYAVGAVAGGIFGDAYPGPGATLGPNMTFGYLAGKHAAES